MRYVGFFSEQQTYPALDTHRPSIWDALLAGPNYPEDLILEYLESGHAIFDMMGLDPDLLDDAISLPGGASLLTDGTWVWRDDLIHHVRRYPLHLPGDFVAAAERNHYKIPPFAIEELQRIAHQALVEVGIRKDSGQRTRGK
jgi:hypothetical protein